jgi:predicted RNA-binding Zn-ribbon protein involved in translation (DUF1610 family)
VQINACPNCNEIASLRRSRSRSIVEKILKKLAYSPYVCRNCGWRGKIFSYKISRNFFWLIFLYSVLFVVAVFLVKTFLKSYFG